MANLSSIARPYALAAFEYAREYKCLDAWKTFLEAASMLTVQSEMIRFLNNPQRTPSQVLEIYSSLLTLDEAQKNFLNLLSQNNRFIALPEMATAYSEHYTALQKSSTVRVITAVKPSQDFQTNLAKALKERTHHDIILQNEIDPSIIGGAVIHIGDRVIDGSIRGKLNRLLETLTD